MGEPLPENTYQKRSRIKDFAATNRASPTPAERRLSKLLFFHDGGKMRGRYIKQHPISGKWIVDFYFPEVRLAIELDGEIHDHPAQQTRDRIKDADAERMDITLVRLRNAEVFAPRESVMALLRAAWIRAKNREFHTIGKRYPL